MKRKYMHRFFGAAAAAFALLTAYESVQLYRAQRVNEAIENRAQVASDMPEAVFARARALGALGDYEAAVRTYKALIQSDRPELRRAALYNLGNLHMRQALSAGADRALELLPLIELAKQSYRDLLREEPGDWDARYNLERALWLAPEVAEDDMDLNRPSEFQRRVMRALPDFKLELP